MADSSAIRKVANIVLSDARRRYIVVSAPGKRNKSDEKITDLLYKACALARETGFCKKIFDKIRYRFSQIVQDLQQNETDIKDELDAIEANIDKYGNSHYAASRGEYLSAKILAKVLGYTFIDSKNLIVFSRDDSRSILDAQETEKRISVILSEVDRAVIPGFYGGYAGRELVQDAKGGLCTFSRGGSDITGALIARAVKARVYENFTDVSGYYAADPRIVENPRLISRVSYKELWELSYMGANVIHQDSIWPVQSSGIPINIKNTFSLDDFEKGTMILSEEKIREEYIHSYFSRRVIGIAGKKGFSVILVEKSMMNDKRGFCRAMLSVFERHNISVDHIPSGIDTMSVVVQNEQLNAVEKEQLIMELVEAVEPDNIKIDNALALIAIVGRIDSRVAADVFYALDAKSIRCRIIDQGSSQLNIIVGVDERNYERAIKALYEIFF
jgi:aspartate kinase